MIGEGLEYTSEELAKIRMTMKRRCAWTVLERMLPRFSVYQLRLARARDLDGHRRPFGDLPPHDE